MDVYSQGVNTKIEELENTIQDKFTVQGSKLFGLEERINKDSLELNKRTEETKLIVQKFSEQEVSIEKMFTDIETHSGVLEEILALKASQMSRIDGLGLDFEEKIEKLSGENR